jgi:hypothetical protein
LDYVYSTVNEIPGSQSVIAGYSNLKTSELDCSLTVEHPPETHEHQSLEQMDQATLRREILGQDAIWMINASLNTCNAADHLEYPAIRAKYQVLHDELSRGVTFRHIISRHHKAHHALRPRLFFREAVELKKKTLDRYNRDVYFFTDYITAQRTREEASSATAQS